jgi:dTDP-glucose 4,6-dehydratase
MKILITGGAGFIGANLVHQLIRETDHELLVIDKLTYAGNRASLDPVKNDPRFSFHSADLVDAELLNQSIKNFQPDAVMHLAAESHVDRSIDGPAAFVNTNVIGTFNLLQAVTNHWQTLDKVDQAHFRFLHVSTDEVYGSLNSSDRPFTELSPYRPNSPYSATKAGSDHLVKAWGTTYGLPILVTNCSNNYGPYQFPEKLIPVVILCALKNEPIPVYGVGDHVRDWLHVEDHCRGLRLVLEKGTFGQTYNIGGDQEMSNLALVKAICEVLDELSPRNDGEKHSKGITFVEDRPGHDFRYAIDSTKIREQLRWRPQRSFEQDLKTTVEWYLDNKPWWHSILDGSYRLERLRRTSI